MYGSYWNLVFKAILMFPVNLYPSGPIYLSQVEDNILKMKTLSQVSNTLRLATYKVINKKLNCKKLP